MPRLPRVTAQKTGAAAGAGKDQPRWLLPRRSSRAQDRRGGVRGDLMKLGTVSVGVAERVAVAVDDAGERAVVLYQGPTVAGLIEDWPAARGVVERAVTD